MSSLERLNHHRFDLVSDFAAPFRQCDHRILGDNPAHSRQELWPYKLRVLAVPHLLSEKIDFLANWAHRDRRMQRHREIVGSQGIDLFGKALIPDIVFEHIIPRRMPVVPFFERLLLQPPR
jgi:hypothetical protein